MPRSFSEVVGRCRKLRGGAQLALCVGMIGGLSSFFVGITATELSAQTAECSSADDVLNGTIRDGALPCDEDVAMLAKYCSATDLSLPEQLSLIREAPLGQFYPVEELFALGAEGTLGFAEDRRRELGVAEISPIDRKEVLLNLYTSLAYAEYLAHLPDAFRNVIEINQFEVNLILEAYGFQIGVSIDSPAPSLDAASSVRAIQCSIRCNATSIADFRNISASPVFQSCLGN